MTMMQTRRIGSLSVSVVGLGCNNFGGRIDYDRTQAVIYALRNNWRFLRRSYATDPGLSRAVCVRSQ